MATLADEITNSASAPDIMDDFDFDSTVTATFGTHVNARFVNE
jgi:hypothetical protein